jgi:sugar lactone lactonase YvrE
MTSMRRGSRIGFACLVIVALLQAPAFQVHLAAVNAQYVFTTLAGVSSIGSADGTGANARFNLPRSVTLDSAGNAFVADSLNGTIRKVTPAGVVTTFAGVPGLNQVAQDGTGSNARFAGPIAITTGPGDVLYVADKHAIRTITPGAVVTTLAGDANTPGSIDNTGTAARFHSPLGLDLDSAGNVIVADTTNCLIRKVTPGGVVTTILGVLFACTVVDGSAGVARFQIPYGLAIDSQDNIYVSEFLARTIRKITPALDVSTFAGTQGGFGSADGVGPAASFATPAGLTTDGTNLYLADQDNQTIRKITSGAAVTTVAGLAPIAGSANGTGSAARFRSPTGVALDVSGNLFVADAGNNAIRKITPAAVVTTLAGRPNIGSADGFPTVARFNTPRGIAVDIDGNAYVADSGNHTIRKIAPGGTVSTLAGLAGSPGYVDGLGSGARFSSPNEVTLDHDGNVYVADTGNLRVRKITPGGLVTTVAGSGANANTDGVGTAAAFGNLSGITIDGNGNLFVSDVFFHTIRKIAPPNIVTTFAGVAGQPGSTDGTTAARFNQPVGVAADGGNNIWVADSNTNIIRRISPAGVVATMAGLAGQFGGEDGLGPAARFSTPRAIAADGDGNAYVLANSTIRKITPVGLTSTIGGPNGDLANGPFRDPEGIAIDAALSLYIADTGNHLIRKGDLPTGTVSVNPTSLKFGAVKNGAAGALTVVPPPQDVTVSFVTTGGPWTASTSTPWLQVTNATGNGAGAFTVGIVNPGNVIGGNFTLAGTVTLDAPTAANSPIVINVTLNINWTVSTPIVPIGQVDAPAFNALGLQGAIGVSGWALDNVGVASVKIWRNCLEPLEPASNCIFGLLSGSPSTGLVYIGDAAFVAGARPDLESALPQYPQNNRAGWGYLLLTTMLPRTAGGPFAPYGGQGPLTIYAIATDLENNVTVLGRVWNVDHNPTPITMNNDAIAKPFGAIDTPTQGGTVSSVIGNFGWVLTPDLNTIADGTDILMPTNGSTLFVYLDGLPVANVTYNQCRGTVGNPPPGGVYCDDDVASIFGNLTPQAPLTPRVSNPTKFRNLDVGRGPQGSWALDTTLLSNGLHSIAWSATDSNGRIEGIGSRNFTVLNTGGARPVSDAEIEALLAQPAQSRGRAATLEGLRISKRPVSMRTGFDPRTVMKEIDRSRDFVRTVTVAPMDRVELGFASAIDGGYLVANGELRDLPVGSSLDRRTGVFAWTPPLGYLGTYRLAFVLGSERVIVEVTVANK